MTITQLKIVLQTARQGSISAAAKDLGIPQPNASSGIKSLEKELNFKIFKRARSGIELTEKGQLFLEHAQRILDENERICDLSKVGHVFQLRVGCSNYYRGRTAFVNLFEKHQDELFSDLQYYSVSIEKGISLLSEHKLDVVVGLTIDTLFPTIKEMANQKNLTLLDIDDTVPVITIRKDHPIIKNGLFTDKPVNINILKEYPYVAYHNLNADFEAPYYRAVFKVPCKYTLYVDETDTRLKLVKNSNAFVLGGTHPQEMLDQYNLVEFPYPDYKLKVIALYRDLDEYKKEVEEYINMV